MGSSKSGSSKLVIGAKQTFKAVTNDKAAKVYIARDAEEHVTKKIIDACNSKSIDIVYIDTMKELGDMCGIDVGAATAAELK
ncbi:ribosomal protein L7Ae/L30e/S12e/Gadd45 [Thermoanaerobacterium thermosaccharolyticum DSM 571]|jgi:large subunit ribosomal protein L7A|uniref:Ribosomal protein L7Ae/L30e/S12e/Gadd45 n=2 Tax=Thermoanaerobacterium thermosaccharolyticum TaxID=1517 RepID=D9TRU8_THETC|nr:ribosomal L7Ae/L30e/S12e/Gadd45 family protein [Thermoanaerobacterium thermosaccharolyticum]ADL67995.1 ribosomal protein L7Ae/L30e/S12e/Gadd45 [Thermoanaerobacterium thermosaccharolyticum DSM 571]OXT05805.1 50S ribosomal protein L7ae-like protein [Thermoanaerobacterium thermosaccharolyticum]